MAASMDRILDSEVHSLLNLFLNYVVWCQNLFFCYSAKHGKLIRVLNFAKTTSSIGIELAYLTWLVCKKINLFFCVMHKYLHFLLVPHIPSLFMFVSLFCLWVSDYLSLSLSFSLSLSLSLYHSPSQVDSVCTQKYVVVSKTHCWWCYLFLAKHKVFYIWPAFGCCAL